MTDPKITLYTLGDAFGMRNVSPFCLKLEMLFAHLQLDYEMIVKPDPRKAPKGKLPYAEVNGKLLADSEVIMSYVDEVTGGRVYAGLSDRDKAYGLALTRLAEEHLYWFIVASRWLDEDWFPNVVRDFFGIAPAIVRPFVARAAQRQVRQTLNLHGLGRHSPEEQHDFARRDLQTLQDAVGDGPYLFGTELCVFDLAITALLTGAYYHQPPTWITPVAQEYSALSAYIERVQNAVGVHALPQD